jgi:hypothetical protein
VIALFEVRLWLKSQTVAWPSCAGGQSSGGNSGSSIVMVEWLRVWAASWCIRGPMGDNFVGEYENLKLFQNWLTLDFD